MKQIITIVSLILILGFSSCQDSKKQKLSSLPFGIEFNQSKVVVDSILLSQNNKDFVDDSYLFSVNKGIGDIDYFIISPFYVRDSLCEIQISEYTVKPGSDIRKRIETAERIMSKVNVNFTPVEKDLVPVEPNDGYSWASNVVHVNLSSGDVFELTFNDGYLSDELKEIKRIEFEISQKKRAELEREREAERYARQTVTSTTPNYIHVKSDCFAGVSKESYNRLMKAIGRNDMEEVNYMIVTGQIDMLKAHTKISIVDKGIFMTQVRVNGVYRWLDSQDISW